MVVFSKGFEHLLTSSNLLNRKMEEVLGMTKEYDTIAALWARFHILMRSQGGVDAPTSSSQGANRSSASEEESLVAPLHDSPIATNPNAPSGLPGTGGYTLQVPASARKASTT